MKPRRRLEKTRKFTHFTLECHRKMLPAEKIDDFLRVNKDNIVSVLWCRCIGECVGTIKS